MSAYEDLIGDTLSPGNISFKCKKAKQFFLKFFLKSHLFPVMSSNEML